jgi:hypothetical protein
VVDETAAVEDDRVDPGRFGTLANDLADCAGFDTFRCLRPGPIEDILLQVTGCYQRPPSVIVDDLSIDMRG